MLNDTQKNNAIEIINILNSYGITNNNTIAAILSVVIKETQLIPKSENLNYSAKRIKQVFPKVTEQKAKELEFKPEQFGNYIYGDKPSGYRDKTKSLGNGINEGFKFRGRAFNQLTGKKNYKIYGDLIKKDLINNPDLANEPQTAAKILFFYFKRNADNYKIDLNKLNFSNAYNIIYAFNAGKLPTTSGEILQKKDTTGGYLIGKKYFPFFLNFLNENPNGEIKKKINIGFILAIIGVTIIIIKNKKL